MYKVEIEKTDGNCFFYGEPDYAGGTEYEEQSNAYYHAETLWLDLCLEDSGMYARVSVVENSDGTINDWWVSPAVSLTKE